MVNIDTSGGGGTTILANETLPQAANAWAKLLPPFEGKLATPFALLHGIAMNRDDVATLAAISATADWGDSYIARYNQRGTSAQTFGGKCVTSWQILAAADQTGGDKISAVTPGAAGPTLV